MNNVSIVRGNEGELHIVEQAPPFEPHILDVSLSIIASTALTSRFFPQQYRGRTTVILGLSLLGIATRLFPRRAQEVRVSLLQYTHNILVQLGVRPRPRPNTDLDEDYARALQNEMARDRS